MARELLYPASIKPEKIKGGFILAGRLVVAGLVFDLVAHLSGRSILNGEYK